MPPSPRFDKLDPERRDSILDEASRQFAERGYEGASYNRILEQAGVSKGAAYYYFHDKQDLYETVLTRAIDRVIAAIGDIGEFATPDEFWEQFATFYRRGLAFLRAHPILAALAASFVKAPPLASSRAVSSSYSAGRNWSRRLLERGQAVGAVRTDVPMDLLTDLVFGTGEILDRWTLSRWKELREEDTELIVALGIDFYRRMLTPAPPRKDAS